MATDTFRSLQDFEKYGIHYLTGEACGYGLRILCDLNEDGVNLLKNYFGMRHDNPFAGKWNNTVNGKPAIASIMLPREIVPALAIFICFHIEKCQYFSTEGMYGFNDSHIPADWSEEERERFFKNIRRNWCSPDPSISQDGRNVHQMSGRVT